MNIYAHVSKYYLPQTSKITILQPILQIKQLRLLFNPCKDIRDAFWNKQEHGINPVQLR